MNHISIVALAMFAIVNSLCAQEVSDRITLSWTTKRGAQGPFMYSTTIPGKVFLVSSNQNQECFSLELATNMVCLPDSITATPMATSPTPAPQPAPPAAQPRIVDTGTFSPVRVVDIPDSSAPPVVQQVKPRTSDIRIVDFEVPIVLPQGSQIRYWWVPVLQNKPRPWWKCNCDREQEWVYVLGYSIN